MSRRFPLPYLAFNGFVLLVSPLLAVYLAERFYSGKSREGWEVRMGELPAELLNSQKSQQPTVWIHAVSAGEVVAAAPIVRETRSLLPQHRLLFSVTTPAGMEMAIQQIKPHVDHVFYDPFDFPWVTRKVVRCLRPMVYVTLESDLWPNITHELKLIGAKTMMVNGRLSEESYQNSKRYVRWLYKWILDNMDMLLVQSEADAERVRTLGEGLDDPGRVQVLGNSKFDQEVAQLSAEQVVALRQSLGLPPDAPVFIAGSTRSPEEETQVIAAYKVMRQSFPNLCLIIAPRQIERGGELAEAMQKAGLRPVLKTQLEAGQSVEHLILNTMGELANVYAVGTIAFVGNSFEPVNKGGGQNPIQPLAHGKPVLVGPRHSTIRAEVALIKQAGLGFEVQDGTELATKGVSLLNDPQLLNDISERAVAFVAAQRGASQRYAKAIADMAQTC